MPQLPNNNQEQTGNDVYFLTSDAHFSEQFEASLQQLNDDIIVSCFSSYEDLLFAQMQTSAALILLDTECLDGSLHQACVDICLQDNSSVIQPLVAASLTTSAMDTTQGNCRPPLLKFLISPQELASLCIGWLPYMDDEASTKSHQHQLQLKDSMIQNLHAYILQQIQFTHKQNRQATLGFLTAGLGHELNNLLMALSCMSELAQLKPERLAELPERIIAQCDRGQDFSRYLLQYAKAKPTEILTVKIADEIATIHYLLENMLRKQKITIDSHVSETIEIRFAGGMLQQVLLNIMLNAIQFMPNGGRITITAKTENHELQLDIRDNGPGIPIELLPTIFIPLVTGKPETGVGLGLAICKFLIEEAGGNISASNCDEGGSIFSITLPLKHETDKSTSPQRPETCTQERILLVEDDKSISSAMCEMLESRGYCMKLVEEGGQALNISAEQEFDIVLLDINLPDKVSGIDVGHFLRERQPKAKIIVVTGELLNDKLSTFATSMDGLIQKPFRMKHLLQTISTATTEVPFD